MQLKQLVIFTSLLAISQAKPLAMFEPRSVLDSRAAGTKTNVSLAPQRIGWGNVKPVDVFRKALNAVCSDALEGCDFSNTGPLTVPTSLYQADGQTVVAADIVFTPEGSASGDISNFVDCLASAIQQATTCTTEKVIVIEGTSTITGQAPATSEYTDTFCQNTNWAHCRRVIAGNGASGAVTADLQVGITVKESTPEAFNFCNVLSLVSSITGLVEGLAGGIFGIAAVLCTADA